MLDRGHRAPGPHRAKRRGGLAVYKDAHPKQQLQLVQVSRGISLDELALDDPGRWVDRTPRPMPDLGVSFLSVALPVPVQGGTKVVL